ncbi:MAG: GspE/PulE family protein, partial [Planctomycetota bacterium]|nr:GspE/PulE family protein [Planctomycetota bacterium]
RFAVEAALRRLTNHIHSASLDEILLSLGDEIRGLFKTQRITIYMLDRFKKEIYSKVMDGSEVKEIRVPVGVQSLAGFVAISGRALRINDAYDDAELRTISPELHFDMRWDQKTGFRTKQVLVVPVKARRRVEGVIQLVNHDNNKPFTKRQEQTLLEVAETLSIAFNNQRQITVRRSRFDYLISKDYVNEDILDAARGLSQKDGSSVECQLIDKYKIPKKEILISASRFFRVQTMEYNEEVPTPPEEVLVHFTIDYCKYHSCFPLSVEENKVVLVMSNPKDVITRDDIAQRLNKEDVEVRVAVHEDILRFIDKFFPQPEVTEDLPPEVGALSDIIGQMDQERLEDDPNAQVSDEAVGGVTNDEDASGLIRLVNQIIEHAYHRGVSDIHVEPYTEDDCVVRFRIDGVCQNYTTVPRRYARAMVSRLKIMSGLDIAERRLPQDGKIKFKNFGALDIELRVATLPTQGGQEDCVMRILAASEPMPLDNMGFTEENLTGFKDAVSKPYGLVLVVGPTGSGKTTTLHSALGYINKPETKIWTAEDPVEITQKGLRQVQVSAKIGFTFERALRAFLRADPDVIMIGEMRDAETAEAGVEASLTGHLVFSTLHTNSAPETVTRLLDMGLDPYSFGDSLLGVLAQRLMRRLCSECKETYKPDAEEIEMFRREFDYDPGWEQFNLASTEDLFRKSDSNENCRKCGGSGYKGRMGIHEFMPGSDGIRGVIYSKGLVRELREVAINEGMTTLKQDGIRKVMAGHTDISEVRRVCIK